MGVVPELCESRWAVECAQVSLCKQVVMKYCDVGVAAENFGIRLDRVIVKELLQLVCVAASKRADGFDRSFPESGVDFFAALEDRGSEILRGRVVEDGPHMITLVL